MSTEHPRRTRDAPLETDASAGYEEEMEVAHAENGNQIEEETARRADRIAAATREDRPAEYRRKQAMGVTT